MRSLSSEELEQELVKQIGDLYLDQFGHCPGEVACKIFDNVVAVLIKDSITKPEQLLVSSGQFELAKAVREELESIVRPKLEQLFESTTRMKLVELLVDTHMNTRNSSAIAILSRES